MIKEINTTVVGRYKNLPFFRSIPIDGVNTAADIEMEWKDTGSGEYIYLTITHSAYDKVRRKVNPRETIMEELRIPGHIYHRFTTYLSEVAEIPLRPRAMDVGKEGEVLLQRRYMIRDFIMEITIQINSGYMGNDRTSFLTFKNPKFPHEHPEGLLHFPWAQTGEITSALKSLHAELYQNKLL